MKIENIKATVVPATAIEIRDDNGDTIVEETTKSKTGLLVLRIDESSRADVQEWLRDWASRPSWREIPAALTLRKWYKSKTLDQLGLVFSLCKIMALEQDHKYDESLKMGYYHGLLEWYGPRVTARLPDGREKESIKSASQMNTIELSRVIEGAFRELALMGVHFESSNQVKNYYLEWRTFRGRLKVDGLEETYASLEEYKDRVPFCEATLKHLAPKEGHLAHIVSKGAGADTDETWNYLHLSAEVHIGLQHTQGWVEMLKTYPHLVGKVNAARVRLGRTPIKEPEDLYEDLDMRDADEAAEIVDAIAPGVNVTDEPDLLDGSDELVNKVVAAVIKEARMGPTTDGELFPKEPVPEHAKAPKPAPGNQANELEIF